MKNDHHRAKYRTLPKPHERPSAARLGELARDDKANRENAKAHRAARHKRYVSGGMDRSEGAL